MVSTSVIHAPLQTPPDAQAFTALQSSSSLPLTSVSMTHTPPVFWTICTTKGIDEHYDQAIKKTLRTWVTVLDDRTKLSRQNAAQGGDESKKKLKEDLKTYWNYLTLTQCFSEYFEDSYSVTLLVDHNHDIQAMAATSLKAHNLYVWAIISAAWNLKMHAHVPQEKQCFKVQRAGSTLMHALYYQAQVQQVSELRLGSNSTSYTFYKDALCMHEDASEFPEDHSEFYYPVSKDHVPERLRFMSAGFEALEDKKSSSPRFFVRGAESDSSDSEVVSESDSSDSEVV